MFLKTVYVSLGLLFALTPLAHAGKADDLALQQLADESITEACNFTAEGAMSLKVALIQKAKENVKWLAVAKSMSTQLRTHLASNLVGLDGSRVFYSYLNARKNNAPDNFAEDIEVLTADVEEKLMTLGKNPTRQLEYELTEWKTALKDHFGLSTNSKSILSVNRRKLQYAEAVVKIAATAFVTLPTDIRMLIPSDPPKDVTGSVTFSFIVGFCGFFIHAVLGNTAEGYVTVPAAIVAGAVGGILGAAAAVGIHLKIQTRNKREGRNVAPELIGTSQVSTFTPLSTSRVAPAQGLRLIDVFWNSNFPKELASGAASIVDAVQLGAWELAVLVAGSEAKDISPEAKWDLALRAELLARDLGELVANFNTTEASGIPIFAAAKKALENRLKEAITLSRHLIEDQAKLRVLDEAADAEMRLRKQASKG